MGDIVNPATDTINSIIKNGKLHFNFISFFIK